MSASTLQQVRALTWRYWLSCLQWPISTGFRVIVWPGFLIAFVLVLINYTLDPLKSDYKAQKMVMAMILPGIIGYATMLHTYHYSRWIVSIRENGMKSLMLSMNIRRISIYLSDCICFAAPIVPVVMFLAIVSLKQVFDDSLSSPLAILTVFILFIVHLTGVVFALGSLFNTVKYASFIILILIFEGPLHYLILLIAKLCSESSISTVLFIASLSPFESLRILFSSYSLCKNCNESREQVDEAKLVSQPTSLIIVAMLFWTFVAFGFARWFEEVCPWQRDSAVKKPLFCFQSSSSATPYQDYSLELIGGIDTSIGQSKYFENVIRANRKVGISVSKLRKLYNSVPAVDDLSFDVYKGETTLLLGHNGAGKTTLMDIILGRLAYDSGKVTVNEESLNSGGSTGVCPQNSVLDEHLTVRQHLELFYDLKCPITSQSERDRHIEQTIRDVYLTENMHKRPNELSGGMQRKLSLGLAFVGNSSVLILDEPSSGLDPESRGSLWQTIRRYRKDRTVLLSTQHMEEADFLGDRVAIMRAGKIICCGSSMFLNDIFGSGYKLRVECKASDSSQALGLVRKHFLGADFADGQANLDETDDSSHDLLIELNADPSDEYESKLVSLLEDLEKDMEADSSIITSFGIKSSSMDDVLLKTKDVADKSQPPGSTRVTIKPLSENITSFARVNAEQSEKLTDQEEQKLLFRALIIKNFQVWNNDRTAFLTRLLLACFCCWFVLRFLQNSMTGAVTFGENFLGLGMINYFVYYPTIESATKFKTIQLGTNANFVTYWLAQLASDMILIALLVVEMSIMLMTLFDGVFVASAFEIYMIVSLAILLYGIASALLAYVFSTILRNIERSMAYFSLLFILNPMVDLIISLIGVTTQSNTKNLINAVDHLFALVSPLEAMQRVLLGLVEECYVQGARECQPITRTIPLVMYGFACLILQVAFYAGGLYIIEKKQINILFWIKSKIQGSQSMVNPRDMGQCDEDVLEENRNALHLIDNLYTAQTTHSLLAVDLCKSYTPKVRAVDHLSFTVKKGECFGLLGVNGAGKTTAFSMLAKEFAPDSGRVWMGAERSLGYDPQSNPDMFLTVEQALYLMARLRRVPERNIVYLTESLIELLELTEHSKKVAKMLSGGSKRKLYLAMSLIGNAGLLALDEPTAGVDPMARRNVWALLRSVRRQNKTSIVVSSHVMEECEAICSRMAIMARGRLRCLGTLLHLRSKFSQSCTVRVQFASSAEGNGDLAKDNIVSELQTRLENELSGSALELVDTNFNSATFSLSGSKLRRSILFNILREFRSKHPQMRYQVNDSSFEDIFLAVAREQGQLDGKSI